MSVESQKTLLNGYRGKRGKRRTSDADFKIDGICVTKNIRRQNSLATRCNTNRIIGKSIKLQHEQVCV